MDAVSYVRYSSHNQRDASLEDQERANEEAAAAAGDTIVAVYFDRAVSGTTDRRDGFQAMVRDAEGSRWRSIPTIVCDWGRVWTYKTDRFARDRYDAAVYKRRLKKRRIDVKYAAEQIPDGPVGILMESVLEGLAEYYSANLGENVARGLNGNALKCHPNGVRLYGWDIAGARIDEDGKYHPGDHYEINEHEAEAVRIMYKLRALGWSYVEIARRASELGHLTKRGEAITPRYVTIVTHDARYKGVYRFGDVRIEGGILAIVTPEEWEAAQNPKRTRTKTRWGRGTNPRPRPRARIPRDRRKGNSMEYDIEYYTKASGSLMCHDAFSAETREQAEAKAMELLGDYDEADYGIVSIGGSEDSFTVVK